MALKPIFAHINNVHLIRDDVIIATKNMPDHIKAVRAAMEAEIYIFIDAHISGLGAILTQGDNYEDAKPIVIASRITSQSEKR